MNEPINKEQSFKKKKKAGPGWWQPALIGVLCALSGSFPPVMLIAPGLLAYLGVAGGIPLFLAATGVTTALSYLLMGVTGFWLLLAILPTAFLMTAMLRRRAAYFDIVLYGCMLSAGGLYAVYGLRDILAGQSGFYSLQETWRMLSESLSGFSIQGMDTAMVTEMLDLIGDMIPVVMPAVICFMSVGIGLVSLLVCRWLSCRAGAPLKPMSPFVRWAVPKPASRGAFLMGVGLILCAYVLKLPDIEAIAMACSVVIFAPFTIQGLSFVSFLLRARRGGQRPRGKLLLGLLALMLIVFPMGFVSIIISTCTMLGLIEQFWRVRERFPGTPVN